MDGTPRTTTYWTAPYYGVQHLYGLRPGFSASITAHGDGLAIAHFKTRPGFVDLEERQFTTAADARAWCEARVAATGATL